LKQLVFEPALLFVCVIVAMIQVLVLVVVLVFPALDFDWVDDPGSRLDLAVLLLEGFVGLVAGGDSTGFESAQF